MDLNGIQNIGQGLLDGYKTGLQLKRQQAADAAEAEDRAYLREQRTTAQVDRERQTREHEEDREQKAQDRTQLLQDRGEDRARLKVTQGRDDAKYEREQKELAFTDNVRNVLRQLMPAYQSGQHDAVIRGLQQAYNENPTFKDGYQAQFAQDANGNLVRDKDGNYAMTLTDATGKPLGQPQALTAQDAMMMFGNQLSPEKTLEHEQAERQAKALRVENDARWKKRIHIQHDLSLDSQRNQAALTQQNATFEQQLKEKGLEREFGIKLQQKLKERQVLGNTADLTAEDLLKAKIDVAKAILGNDISMKVTPEQAAGRADGVVRALTQPKPKPVGPRVKAAHANTPDGQAFIRIYNDAMSRGDAARANEALGRARKAGLLEQ